MDKKDISKYIAYNSYAAPQRKGRDLLNSGSIVSYKAIKGKVQAKVKGTRMYDVAISYDDDGIDGTYCSCPYDHGGICKHRIAVLYKMMENPPKSLNPYKKLHNTNDWFLIADNNELSYKDIISRFGIETNKRRYGDVSAEIIGNKLNLLVQTWTGHLIDIKSEDGEVHINCDCGGTEKSLCEHQELALVKLYKNVNDDFFNQLDKENIKRLKQEIAKKNKLDKIPDYEKHLSPKIFNKKIVIIPEGKLSGLILSDAEANKINFLDDIVLTSKEKKPFWSDFAGNISNDFDLGFVFYSRLNSNQYNFIQINPIIGKISKKGDKLINPIRSFDDYEAPELNFSELDIQIFDITKKTMKASIEDYFFQNRINEHDYSENQAALARYYSPIFKEIIPLLKSRKYLYYNNIHSSRVPLNISTEKVNFIYELTEDSNFYDLSLKIDIGNKKYEPEQLQNSYFGPLMLLINDTAYFLDKPEDDDILNNAFILGNSVKVTKDNFSHIFQYVKQIAAKYDVKINLKSIKVNHENIDIKKKQVFISEVDKFIIFTPLVEYNDGFQANIFESGNILNYNEKTITKLERDKEFEAEFLELMRSLHINFSRQTMLDYFYLTYDELLHEYWFFEAFDKLKEQKVEVFGFEKLSKLKYNPNKAKVAVSVSSGIDWFEVNVDVAFGNQHVALKDIRKAILKKERFVKLSDGTLGILPEEWYEKFEAYFRQGEVKNDKINVSKLKFNIIEDLFKKQDYSEIAKEIVEKKKRLKEFSSIKKVNVPAELQGELRDYQKAGFNWLNFLDQFKWGGILADDMGLGKTIQVIAFLLKIHSKKRNASLVVLPTTLLFNWKNELEKFAPSLKVMFHYGQDRDDKKIDVKNNDLIITSYGIMARDIALLKKYKFSYIILDESQAIKNPESLRFKATMLLKAENKIAMTGTPIENNTFDLYAQMEFLNPGFLGSKKHFKEQYSDAIDKAKDSEVAKELQKIVNPFIIRRTKEQVASELPDKTENYMFCEMEPEQRKVYDAYRNKYRNMLLQKIDEEGIGKSKIYVIEGLMKLRQICDSPAILSDEEDYGSQSVKIKELIRHIKEKTGNHKILVFSQFVKMLTQIKNKLEEEGIEFEYLDGQSNQKARQESVKNFQENEKIRVFLISLKAGGTGINLTSADYVYLVDPWWNPAVESQAIDRTHRIGQDKKVIAYRMICKDTIEEKIMEYQKQKLKVASEIISTEENFVKQLKKDDISELFN